MILINWIKVNPISCKVKNRRWLAGRGGVWTLNHASALREAAKIQPKEFQIQLAAPSLTFSPVVGITHPVSGSMVWTVHHHLLPFIVYWAMYFYGRSSYYFTISMDIKTFKELLRLEC